jgi:hypothetical protein
LKLLEDVSILALADACGFVDPVRSIDKLISFIV